MGTSFPTGDGKTQDSKQIFTSFDHAVKAPNRMDKKWKDLLEERINYNQEFMGLLIFKLWIRAYAEEKQARKYPSSGYEEESGTGKGSNTI